MKKKFKIVITLFIIMISVFPINIKAKTNNIEVCSIVQKKFDPNSNTADNQTTVELPSECQSILGDVNNENSTAWLLQTVLNYIKILGPMLAIALGSVDFAKAIVSSDEESMKKAQKRFIYRLVAAMLLFFIPLLTGVVLNTFGFTTNNATCGLK